MAYLGPSGATTVGSVRFHHIAAAEQVPGDEQPCSQAVRAVDMYAIARWRSPDVETRCSA